MLDHFSDCYQGPQGWQFIDDNVVQGLALWRFG
jgi:hypothetical protein